MKFTSQCFCITAIVAALLPGSLGIDRAQTDADYWVIVTNEKSGDLTLIDGATQKAAATFLVGKRPRGIHASPDGRTLYVARERRPFQPPPQMVDATGNPILGKSDDDDDDDKNADKSADGIAVVDVTQRKSFC